MKRLSPLLSRAGLRYLLHHRWQALLALSRPAEAEPILRDALARADESQASAEEVWIVRANLGLALSQLNRDAEALTLLEEAMPNVDTDALSGEQVAAFEHALAKVRSSVQ